MKFFSLELRSLMQFIFIGIIWGIVPIMAQLRNYSSWQGYWKEGNPCLFFLAGFSGSFSMSLYKYYLDSKETQK